MGSKRSLTLLGWRVVVFLCLHVFAALSVGGGCGCVFGLGMKCLIADEHTVGFTFNTVLASAACCWWWLPAQLAWRVFFWVRVVCGGLFVICIVVASIFVLYCFLCFV